MLSCPGVVGLKVKELGEVASELRRITLKGMMLRMLLNRLEALEAGEDSGVLLGEVY